MENSLVYVILVLFLLVLFIVERKFPLYRNSIRKICVLVYILFWGFRGYIGSDWYNYNYFYESNNNVVNFQFSFEIGFDLLVWMCLKLGLSYFNFVLLISIIQIWLFDRIISKYSKNIALSYIILIAIFPIVVIDLLRNFTSLLIVFSGIHCLLVGNSKKFLVYVFIGSLFHTSAIFFIILFFCKSRLPSRKTLVILFCFGIIIYLLKIDIFSGVLRFLSSISSSQISNLINTSVSKDEESYGIGIGIVEKIFMCILLIKYYSVFSQGKNVLFVNCMILYVLINLYCGFSQSFINRFASLFLFGYIIWYNDLFFYYKPQFKVNFLAFCVLFFFMFRVVVGYNGLIYRYSNVLFDTEDFNQRLSDRSFYYRDRGEI